MKRLVIAVSGFIVLSCAVLAAVVKADLPLAVVCDRAVQPFGVSTRTTFWGVCFDKHPIGQCVTYTYAGTLVED
jgi:hypothetical protein